MLQNLRSILWLEGMILLGLLLIVLPIYYVWNQTAIFIVAVMVYIVMGIIAIISLSKNYWYEYITLYQGVFFMALMFLPLGHVLSCKILDTLITGWNQ